MPSCHETLTRSAGNHLQLQEMQLPVTKHPGSSLSDKLQPADPPWPSHCLSAHRSSFADGLDSAQAGHSLGGIVWLQPMRLLAGCPFPVLLSISHPHPKSKIKRSQLLLNLSGWPFGWWMRKPSRASTPHFEADSSLGTDSEKLSEMEIVFLRSPGFQLRSPKHEPSAMPQAGDQLLRVLAQGIELGDYQGLAARS